MELLDTIKANKTAEVRETINNQFQTSMAYHVNLWLKIDKTIKREDVGSLCKSKLMEVFNASNLKYKKIKKSYTKWLTDGRSIIEVEKLWQGKKK